MLRYKEWGLLAFIAIPLPGTGGWTGSLFAALLNIDFKKALPIVAIGVFIADVIMSVLTYGTGAVIDLFTKDAATATDAVTNLVGMISRFPC